MAPKLSIGMAVHTDFDGPWFTIQDLRLHHNPSLPWWQKIWQKLLGRAASRVMEDVEIIVVDNNPDCAESDAFRRFLGNSGPRRGDTQYYDLAGTAGVHYISAPNIVGTSAPRDLIFQAARGEAVMCLDSHVLLAPHSVHRLLQWYADNPKSMDLIQGPLMMDNMTRLCTHFDDIWRGEMWGIWASAWTTLGGQRFQMREIDGRAEPYTLEIDAKPLRLGYASPPWAGHEAVFRQYGCRMLGEDPDDVFDIPGQGLGLFTCRKEAWLGFNPHFRGFGGEEMYIHEKFRQEGHKCLCLGFLKWLHRFGRPGGVKYPLSRYSKVRNYVLGHLELGRDMAPVYEHFVAGDKFKDFTEREWQYLLGDPIRRQTLPTAQPTAKQPPVAAVPEQAAAPTINAPRTVEAIYTQIAAIQRDLDKHMPTLASLASGCQRVTEFTHRRESTIGFAMGQPKSLISYNSLEARNQVLLELTAVYPHSLEIHNQDSPAVATIAETDLLFLDTQGTADRLAGELSKFAEQVTRFIVIHDTVLFGDNGEGGGPGLWYALRPFVAENPEWFVYSHTKIQHGLTVLGRRPEDRPATPVMAWPPGNGPGSELSSMLKTLDIHPKKGCGCRQLAEKMDFEGPDWCEANKAGLITSIKANQDKWKWTEKMATAAKLGKAALKGFDFEVDWLNPYDSFITEAIRRSRLLQNKSVAHGQDSLQAPTGEAVGEANRTESPAQVAGVEN